jgi:hypothetical protein
VTLRVFDGLDHGMREAGDDIEAMATMAVTGPAAPEYLDAVACWFAEVLP